MIPRLLLVLSLTLTTSACGGKHYDVAAWQEKTAPMGGALPPGQTASDRTDAIDKARASLDLTAARDLAIAAVKEFPEDAEVLWRAARAESDSVFLHPEAEKDQRSLSALSSLAYSRRAAEANPESANVQAELAWSLGTTTHLQGMTKRSGHARETRAAIDKALALDPGNARAHATDAMLQFRLCTLPWIANVMASNVPDASLEGAEKSARTAIEKEPSNENRLILAKILAAREQVNDARAVAQQALDAADRFPRDAEYRDSLREFLKSHPEEESE